MSTWTYALAKTALYVFFSAGIAIGLAAIFVVYIPEDRWGMAVFFALMQIPIWRGLYMTVKWQFPHE